MIVHGVNVSLAVNLCDPSPCLYNGTCDQFGDEFVCTCIEGLAGDFCQYGRYIEVNVGDFCQYFYELKHRYLVHSCALAEHHN